LPPEQSASREDIVQGATSTHNGIAHYRVAIIGTGFSGLGMAIRLRQAGEDDFVVFEKEAGVGGTWWVNSYPGCACDVESHLYSFSFEPNPEWQRMFARRRRFATTCSIAPASTE
jgi:cation diffusion facilitator CzcD-associated flavoprotein CzcO